MLASWLKSQVLNLSVRLEDVVFNQIYWSSPMSAEPGPLSSFVELHRIHGHIEGYPRPVRRDTVTSGYVCGENESSGIIMHDDGRL